MAAPPSCVCPLCGLQDYLDPPAALAEGMWQFVCRGAHEVYVFDVKTNKDVAAYPQGLAADLGLYDDLPACVTDESTFVEYGIVEYRYAILHPKEYGQLLATYGHRSTERGRSYTASSFIASTLGRISREGVLRLEFGKGTGYWSYNDPISYWAQASETAPAVRLTWVQFAADAGLDPARWPL